MIRKRIEELLQAINKGIYEKETELSLSLLAALAGENYKKRQKLLRIKKTMIKMYVMQTCPDCEYVEKQLDNIFLIFV